MWVARAAADSSFGRMMTSIGGHIGRTSGAKARRKANGRRSEDGKRAGESDSGGSRPLGHGVGAAHLSRAKNRDEWLTGKVRDGGCEAVLLLQGTTVAPRVAGAIYQGKQRFETVGAIAATPLRPRVGLGGPGELLEKARRDW
jgi:hypothetical protein